MTPKIPVSGANHNASHFHILLQHQRRDNVGLQEDGSGWQEFSYGKLRELTENIRTFALPYEK